MLLQGSFPDFTVVDVLRLMGSATKTGVVRFGRARGGITQTGAIFFRDGVPVSAETDGILGPDALEMLCSWNTGSFSFHGGATSPDENLGQPAGWLMERAVAAEEEWQGIWAVLPSPTSILRLAGELPAGMEEVRIARAEWRVLSVAGAPQTASALAQLAGGGLPAYRMLRKLMEQGLIECRGVRDDRPEPRETLLSTKK